MNKNILDNRPGICIMIAITDKTPECTERSNQLERISEAEKQSIEDNMIVNFEI